MTKSKGSQALTENIAHSFVSSLEQYQKIFDNHPECQNRILISQIIIIKLSMSASLQEGLQKIAHFALYQRVQNLLHLRNFSQQTLFHRQMPQSSRFGYIAIYQSLQPKYSTNLHPAPSPLLRRFDSVCTVTKSCFRSLHDRILESMY